MTRRLFFFRPALLHYRSLTPAAHRAGRAGMCSIELNGMWRIGRPGSENFHCKWSLSHRGPDFILSSVYTNTHYEDCFQTTRAHRVTHAGRHNVCLAEAFALQCRFSHETLLHRERLVLQGALWGQGWHRLTRSTQNTENSCDSTVPPCPVSELWLHFSLGVLPSVALSSHFQWLLCKVMRTVLLANANCHHQLWI